MTSGLLALFLGTSISLALAAPSQGVTEAAAEPETPPVTSTTGEVVPPERLGSLNLDAPPPAESIVVSVYDGDTITLATGQKVRFRFMNTTELRDHEGFAEQAQEATSRMVLSKKVQLFYGANYIDKYGRLVADIHVDGESVAVRLLGLGFAHVMLMPPFEADLDVTPLLEAQTRAKEARLGIWTDPHFLGTLHITSFHANAPGNDNTNVNGEYLRACNISGKDLNLEGYSVTSLRGSRWTFPAINLPPGYTVQIHTGPGVHQIDPSSQLTIFLGNNQPIWNNFADRATIYDSFGVMMDWKDSGPAN